MKQLKYSLLLFLLIFLYGCGNQPGLSGWKEALYGFEHLQDSARTKVWWFHGETETTRAGITADLEAYREQGVGGVVYYDQTHGPCEGALEAFSVAWWEMLLFASQEAERLGLTFEVHVSNGYVSGGPWITPELGMQRLTATDTVVCGGQNLEFSLPVPESSYNYYKDVAVLAVPFQEETGEDSRMLNPLITCDKPDIDAGACFSLSKQLTRIPAQETGKSVYLTLDFGKEFTARSITYEMGSKGMATTSATNVPAPPSNTFVGTNYRILPDVGELEVSDDGLHYNTVCDLKPLYCAHSNWRQRTLAFPAVTGRYYRLNLHDWYEANDANKTLNIGRVVLSSRACVDQWEEKAALYSEYIDCDKTPAYQKAEIISQDRMIDLTAQVDSCGILRWQNVPEGKWLVMRFAHVPTGVRTKHGRKNLIGLECDKMSEAAVEVQWNNYFKRIADSIQIHGGKLLGMAMDSHEAGSQNWTPGFEKEFMRLRGYDLKYYLPVLAGYVVQSPEVSDGFLYDVRRTVADLVSEKYYGTFQRLCQERKMTFTAQATGNALCLVADQIQAKGRVQKPQGEFWAIHPDGNYDIKESSSAAHMYGKPIASAEAFTDAKFYHSLGYIKQLADYAYGYGINEFVVCASAYQPWLDKYPGSTGGGRHYCLNRNNTFWAYSRDFWDYQARCAYLMRQGRPVVDLCLYLGENAPVKILTYRLPDIPGGSDFDAFTTDALLSRMDAQNGCIVLPDGMSYRMMVLPRNGEVTWEALHKIASLVKKGAVVYGTRPKRSGAKCDLEHRDEYKELVNAMWGEVETPQGSNSYGEGAVYWGMSLANAVKEAGMPADLTVPDNRKFYYAHRSLRDGEIYFLDNHEDKALTHTFTFRCKGKSVELWHPVTGKRYALQGDKTTDGRTAISLQMAARESFFIVFHDAGEIEELPLKEWKNAKEEIEMIKGDWRVEFDESRGGPGLVTFSELSDWTVHTDNRIKYYSGTAVYRKSLMVDTVTPDEQCMLRFKKLGDAARIVLNGNEVGTIWCSPWEIDITEYVKTGENELEIYVVNSLMNRMIGDSMLPEDERVTYCATPIATPEDILVPSGIIGEVQYVRRLSSK